MPRAIYQDDHKKIVSRLKQARLEVGFGQTEVAKKNRKDTVLRL